MVINSPVPFPLAGKWSPAKARAIAEKYADVAKAAGLEFEILDVSTFSKQEVYLRLKCLKHGCVVENESTCPACKGNGK